MGKRTLSIEEVVATQQRILSTITCTRTEKYGVRKTAAPHTIIKRTVGSDMREASLTTTLHMDQERLDGGRVLRQCPQCGQRDITLRTAPERPGAAAVYRAQCGRPGGGSCGWGIRF